MIKNHEDKVGWAKRSVPILRTAGAVLSVGMWCVSLLRHGTQNVPVGNEKRHLVLRQAYFLGLHFLPRRHGEGTERTEKDF